jgi:hypothetical protein
LRTGHGIQKKERRKEGLKDRKKERKKPDGLTL